MRFRLIPRLEQSPELVALCRKPAGQWILLAGFTLVLALLNSQWPAIAVFLAVTTALPRHRRALVSVCGIAAAVALPDWIDRSFIDRLAAHEGLAHVPLFAIRLVVAAAFVLLTAVAALAFRYPRHLVWRRPVPGTIVCYSALVAAVSLAPLNGWTRTAAWIGVLALGRMLWFFCYTLMDRNSNHGESAPLQAGLWRPGWMINSDSATPLAKGAAYMRRIEARDADELAVTQIKGLKLLLWALALRVVLVGYLLAVYRGLGIPDFPTAFSHSVGGHPLHWYLNCLSLIAAFFESLLRMSIWGHQVVACVRVAGFRALRNTYQPLKSRTIAEFWNRFYFYFKELLADMFFYPTYLGFFKKRPRLRMVAATMMSACVGNALYHFLRDITAVSELGWWRAIAGFQTYFFYSVVLGAGISISQLRGARKQDPAQSWLRRRFVPVLGVSAFYCFLHIFDDTGRAYGVREHLVFAAQLFGF